jgi:hypothetical protein
LSLISNLKKEINGKFFKKQKLLRASGFFFSYLFGVSEERLFLGDGVLVFPVELPGVFGSAPSFNSFPVGDGAVTWEPESPFMVSMGLPTADPGGVVKITGGGIGIGSEFVVDSRLSCSESEWFDPLHSSGFSLPLSVIPSSVALPLLPNSEDREVVKGWEFAEPWLCESLTVENSSS